MTKVSGWMTAAFAGMAAPAPGVVWAQDATGREGYGFGPQMMGWGGGWYGMVLGPLFMVLAFALAIAVAALLLRWLGEAWQPKDRNAQPVRTPLDVLKERFARGEIDMKEFEDRRRVLAE